MKDSLRSNGIVEYDHLIRRARTLLDETERKLRNGRVSTHDAHNLGNIVCEMSVVAGQIGLLDSLTEVKA